MCSESAETTDGKDMHKNIILVDNENIHLSSVPSLIEELNELWIFVGANQTKIAVDVAMALQPLGDRVHYVQISGNGKNALDFHIAYEIGRLAVTEPDAFFHVISKDTGFDPLLAYLHKQKKILTKRHASLEDLPSVKNREIRTPQQRADIMGEFLRKPTSSRPRTEKTLSNSINSRFLKKLTEPEVKAVIKELEKRKILTVNEGKVSYTLDANDSYPF